MTEIGSCGELSSSPPLDEHGTLPIVRNIVYPLGGGLLGHVESLERPSGLVLAREFESDVNIYPRSPQRSVEGLVSICRRKERPAFWTQTPSRSLISVMSGGRTGRFVVRGRVRGA